MPTNLGFDGTNRDFGEVFHQSADNDKMSSSLFTDSLDCNVTSSSMVICVKNPILEMKGSVVQLGAVKKVKMSDGNVVRRGDVFSERDTGSLAKIGGLAKIGASQNGDVLSEMCASLCFRH